MGKQNRVKRNNKKQMKQQSIPPQKTTQHLPLRKWFLLGAVVSAIAAGIIFIRSQSSPPVMTALTNIFVIIGLLVAVIQTIYSLWPLSRSPRPSTWQTYLLQHPRLLRVINFILIGISVLLLLVSTVIPLPSRESLNLSSTPQAVSQQTLLMTWWSLPGFTGDFYRYSAPNGPCDSAGYEVSSLPALGWTQPVASFRTFNGCDWIRAYTQVQFGGRCLLFHGDTSQIGNLHIQSFWLSSVRQPCQSP